MLVFSDRDKIAGKPAIAGELNRSALPCPLLNDFLAYLDFKIYVENHKTTNIISILTEPISRG